MLKKSFWDRLGIGLSGLCAIHCLFFPVIVALLPLWPVAESIHFWTHPFLFLLIVPTVYYALRSSNVPHRIPQLLYAGLFVIALAWLLHEWVGAWTESAITMAGSVLLIMGHWFNYKYHKAISNESST
ncbi:MAG TPA: MerC domain-containing protein, partial [Balneolaceae bacterium]